MSWLFGKDKKKADANTALAPRQCRHLVLAPRWDNPEDIGKNALAVAYVCDNCHQKFTPAEAEAIIEGRGEGSGA